MQKTTRAVVVVNSCLGAWIHEVVCSVRFPCLCRGLLLLCYQLTRARSWWILPILPSKFCKVCCVVCESSPALCSGVSCRSIVNNLSDSTAVTLCLSFCVSDQGIDGEAGIILLLVFSSRNVSVDVFALVSDISVTIERIIVIMKWWVPAIFTRMQRCHVNSTGS